MEDIQLYASINGAEPEPIKEFKVASRQDTSASKQVKRIPKSPTITLEFYNPFPISSPVPAWAKAMIIDSEEIKADWFRNITKFHWKNLLNNN